MSSAVDINAYSIASTDITVADTVIFEEFYKLKESLDDIESGGSFTEFLIFFAVEDTPENVTFLSNTFTDKAGLWTSKFVRRYRDDMKNEDEMYGWYYFPTEEFLYTLNGERAFLLLSNSLAVSPSVDIPDCWGVMILSILVVVVLTYATAGVAAGSMAAWIVAAYTTGTIIRRDILPIEVQIGLALISLGSTLANSSSSLLSILTQLSNLGLILYNEMARLEFEADLKKIQDEDDKLEKLIEAESFEQTMKYNYTEIYDAEYRQGHEQHPHRKLREQYTDFTVYPQTGMDSRWIQID